MLTPLGRLRVALFISGMMAASAAMADVATVTVEKCVTPTVTAANAYGVNFVVGGKLTFTGALGQKGSGRLRGVSMTVKKVETSGFNFAPFIADPTNSTWTDAAVAAINAADIVSVRPAFGLTNVFSVLGTHTILGSPTNLVGAPFVRGIGNTTLWAIVTSNAVLTNNFTTAGDVTVCIQVEQDQ